MTDTERIRITLPVNPDTKRWIYIDGPGDLAADEWSNAVAILASLEPGIVARSSASDIPADIIGEEVTPCACSPRCLNSATETEHSPYMNDFCGDCTSHRCDVSPQHVVARSALAPFLLTQIASDEEVAAVAQQEIDERGHNIDFDVATSAVFNPGRVLVECDAKRRIIDMHPSTAYLPTEDDAGEECRGCGETVPCPTLRLLALPYAGHAEFNPAWRL